VADQSFQHVPHLAARLRGTADVEGKVARALDTLGPLAGHDTALLDGKGAPFLPVARAAGGDPLVVEVDSPLVVPVQDGALDVVVTLWSGFRGVDPADLVEVDRVLRPGGRLLVVHDYGRDDVSRLRDPDAPEYRLWSRRGGPFLRDGAFRIRVLHCFWTFPSLEEAREILVDQFGERGEAVAAAMKRPRLSWNVAVYHRWRGGEEPLSAASDGGGAEG
jgi:SAM-dependent methyltransferase